MRALLNRLLDSKALLFFMLLLPQFVDRDAPQVPQQLVWLGGSIRRLVPCDWR